MKRFGLLAVIGLLAIALTISVSCGKKKEIAPETPPVDTMPVIEKDTTPTLPLPDD